MQAHGAFTVASALMSAEMLEQALLYPKQSVELDMTFQNIMSRQRARSTTSSTKSDDAGGDLPLRLCHDQPASWTTRWTPCPQVFQDMLKLAQIEKTAQLLAEEIEKTRRRVNALEYVMIPQMQENIRYISMKLEENDRNSTTRLMKVKDMMLQQAIEQKRREDAEAIAEAEAEGA